MSIEPDDEDVAHIIVTSYELESKYSDTCRYTFKIILDMWTKSSSTNSTFPSLPITYSTCSTWRAVCS